MALVMTAAVLQLVVGASLTLSAPVSFSQTPQALVDRAEADFSAGRIAESVAGFDRLIVLVPSTAPILWQRGIGLYFLGRFDECAAQFASYYSVNPTDVENAAWHFLCVARGQSPERARAGLLHAGPDPRIMRAEIYEMLRGRLTTADLVAAAATSVPVAQFYAHLYSGLYFDALGDRRSALAETTLAASDQFRSEGGFMNVVARVHLDMLRRSESGRDLR
jgi:lipoprotein NlpI